MKLTKAHIVSGVYIAIVFIFLINIKLFVNSRRTDKTVSSNTEQIILLDQQVRLLRKNDSIFLEISKGFKDSDSVRFEWLKRNNTLLRENNILLKAIIEKLEK